MLGNLSFSTYKKGFSTFRKRDWLKSIFDFVLFEYLSEIDFE